MDVDKLKRMNVLAETLKVHGLAATREDAASLAGDMVGSPQEMPMVFMEQQEEEVNVPQAQPEQKEETFSGEQVKGILQNFADQFCSEINKMSTKLDEQAQVIAALQSRHEELAQKQEAPAQKPIEVSPEEQPVQELQQPDSQPVQQPAQQPVQQAAAQQEAAKPSPRSGSYNPGDVSIEKFFYCGQK